MKQYSKWIADTIMLLTGIVIFFSCTKYETPASVMEDLEDAQSDTAIYRRVLMINIEGAVGKIVKDQLSALTNLSSLLPHSKYSFDGMSPYNETPNTDGEENALSWASMMTGTTKVKHRINDLTYVPEVSLEMDNTSNIVISYYPTFLYRIKNDDALYRTLCITPRSNLNDRFLNDATVTFTSASDEDSKNKAMEYLTDGDYRFTLVDFKGAFDAGVSGGFSASNSNYTNALKTIDGYIGELVSTIEQREAYPAEEWLVVITSNHGGMEDGRYGGPSDEERNTFSVFYFPNFKEVELQGKMIYSPSFTNEIYGHFVDSINLDYNFGMYDTLIAEAIMRVNPKVDNTGQGTYYWGYWEKMFGKVQWGVYRARTEVKIYNNSATGAGVEEAVTSFSDGLWHSYSVMMMNDAVSKVKRVRVFYDGTAVMNKTYAINVANFKNDSSDFKLGNSAANFDVAELRVWKNAAMQDWEFAANASYFDMPETHPNYENLIGYWKFTDPAKAINDTVWPNEISGKPAMILSKPLTFVKSANTLAAQRKSGNIVIENETIAPQILYWLEVSIEKGWGLDGTVFLSNYTDELYRGVQE